MVRCMFGYRQAFYEDMGGSSSLHGILAGNVKRARFRLGYSQMKLAELCGVSTSFIGDIELEKKYPSPEVLERLAIALFMKPYQLLIDPNDLAVRERTSDLQGVYLELQAGIERVLQEVFSGCVSAAGHESSETGVDRPSPDHNSGTSSKSYDDVYDNVAPDNPTPNSSS